MKKLLILLFLLPLSLWAQKMNGVYTRSQLTTQNPPQCTTCLVIEGDSVGLFVYDKNDDESLASADIIVNTHKNWRWKRARYAGAINFGNASYYTKAQLDPTLNAKVNIGSIGSNSIAMYAESNKSIYSSNIFNANGKIGINTTNPEEQLHVNGNVKFRSIKSWARMDIEGQQLGGDINQNLSGITFGNWLNTGGGYVLGAGGGRVGDWNYDDPYIYLQGNKGVVIASGSDNFGNTAGIFVDTLRNVGIRTTSPTANFNVVGTSLLDGTTTLSSYLNLPVAGSGAVASRGVAFQGNEYVMGYGTEGVAGSNIIGPVYSRVDYGPYSYRWGKHSGAALLADGSNFTTQMVLTNAGNVGVGTTTTPEKLTVEGNTRSNGAILSFKDGSNSLSNQLYLANAANNKAYNWQLNADGSAADFWGFLEGVGWGRIMSILANGNVGIGTASPGGKLEISGMGGSIGLRVKRDTDNILDIYQGGGVTYFDAASSTGQISFSTNGASRMHLSTAGNVGIGTASPAANFHVLGNNNNTARFQGSSGYYLRMNSNGFDSYDESDATSTMYLNYYSGGDVDINNAKVIFKGSGNVGINTASPAAKLHVNGTMILTPVSAATASGYTPVEGQIVIVNTTNATFTSLGLWSYANGGWRK